MPPTRDSATGPVKAIRPWHIRFMAFVTPAYLVFELAFNARLLDVTGGLPPPDALNQIEWWGRLISGVALTLVFWGLALPQLAKRQASWIAIILFLATSAGLSIGGTFHFEERLVASPASTASPQKLRDAYLMKQVEVAVANSSLDLAGFPNGKTTMSSPAGKTFLSFFPLLASKVPDLDEKARRALDVAIRQMVEHKLGDPGALFNKTIHAADEALARSYGGYIAAEKAYQAALRRYTSVDEQAWDGFRRDLRGYHLDPGNVPIWFWARARRYLEKKGLILPAGWDPGNRRPFDEAVERRLQEKAKAAFEHGVRQKFGANLPIGLSWSEFATQPEIRRRWEKALKGAASHERWLTPETSFQTWKERAFMPRVDAEVRKTESRLVAPVSDFAPGRRFEADGRNAMEALLAPAYALIFSIAGALYHLFKSTRYLGKLAFPRQGRLVSLGAATLAVGLGLAPIGLANPVSRSSAFTALSSAVSASGPVGRDVWVPFSRWAIQAQPYFYPENNWIRTNLFSGFGFGWIDRSPAQRGPRASQDMPEDEGQS